LAQDVCLSDSHPFQEFIASKLTRAMTSTKMSSRKWADVDEDEDDMLTDDPAARANFKIEGKVDENGIKLVYEYIERDGKSYKVTKRVRQTTVTKWTNTEMNERKNMQKFGKAAQNSAEVEASHITRSEEEVPIELCKKHAAMVVTNDAEDKFLEDSLDICEKLFSVKKAWTDINRDKQVARETDGPEEKKEAAATASAPTEEKKSTYVPPSLRGKGDGKGGKGDLAQQQEASLRITNLSEDVKEGDLQELFGNCGRLQRVYLAKDATTGLSRGFAFVTYYQRDDAQRAIDKLNGHGYDNLILQVQWAKPKA